jgi:muconate cycloisomerase
LSRRAGPANLGQRTPTTILGGQAVTSAILSPLRITAVTVHVTRIPVRIRRRHGSGDVEGAVQNAILRLDTDAGITGWGDAAPWAVFTGTIEAAVAALHVYLRPLLLGADAARIEALLEAADHAVVGQPEAKAAMEMALFDIVGQASGLPVAELLGGRCRDDIPLSFSVADPDFDRDLDTVKRLYGEGLRLFKMKTGFAGHAMDLKRMERFRKEIPADAELRIDYNQGMNAYDAIRQLRDVEAFKPTFIEQPVPGHQRAALGEITRALDTPILADESVFTPSDALEVASRRLADLVSIKIMKHGGMMAGRKVSAICEAAGIVCYGGDMFETGIAHLAGTHMIAATPNIALGCEFYQATYFLERDLLAEPFPVKNGRVVVPRTPGLGIRVDEERLRHYAIQTLR